MSTIDQIREAKTHEEIEEILHRFETPDYRFASPKTIRKARKIAQQRHEELNDEIPMA